jgi:WD40 repeat protein
MTKNQQFQKWAIRGLTGLSLSVLLLSLFAGHQWQRAQRQRVELLGNNAKALMVTQPVDDAVNAIAAVGLSQSPLVGFPDYSLPTSSYGGLLAAIQESQEMKQFQGHTDSVYSVAFSPDGKRIISGSGDKTLRLWDAQTGQPIGHPLKGHTDSVISVAFSPDGRRTASGSGDYTLRLWDVRTGKPLGQPMGTPAIHYYQDDPNQVMSVAFSPDGKRVVSGSADKTLRLWDVSWQGLLSTACNRLRDHPVLRDPQNDTAREAKATCERFVWK